jgi:hypothetical protein
MSHLLIVVGHLEKRLRCGVKTRKAKRGREGEGGFVFFVGIVKEELKREKEETG